MDLAAHGRALHLAAHAERAFPKMARADVQRHTQKFLANLRSLCRAPGKCKFRKPARQSHFDPLLEPNPAARFEARLPAASQIRNSDKIFANWDLSDLREGSGMNIKMTLACADISAIARANHG